MNQRDGTKAISFLFYRKESNEMYFTDNYPLQEYEKMMRRIPNFPPSGHGVVVICSAEGIESGMATYREVMAKAMSCINYEPFLIRLEKYIRESENNPMEFRNEKHRKVFAEATEKLDKKNYSLMSALYLLTADLKLWDAVKRFVAKNEIQFQDIHFQRGRSGDGYQHESPVMCADTGECSESVSRNPWSYYPQ